MHASNIGTLWTDSNLTVLCKCAAGGKDSNKLNHILGILLSSLPLGQGGLNPYRFVPSCINDAANHMYHDEVC